MGPVKFHLLEVNPHHVVLRGSKLSLTMMFRSGTLGDDQH